MTQEQLQQYFARIDCPVVSEPTLATLAILQRNHALTIPFENLNPLLDIPVLLDYDTLFHKLVIDKRGGYCYEQNILFLEVLKTLGFDARGITGRVMVSGRKHPRRTHMLLLITIEENHYISDVGFGSSAACSPLLLQTDVSQHTPSGDYQLLSDNSNGFILQTKFNGEWRSLYHFDLQEQFHEDFEVGNWYTSTHPEANFKNDLMFSLKGDKCRHTLHNNIFSTYFLDGSKEKRTFNHPEEIRTLLEKTFKIKLNNLPGLNLKLKSLIENAQNDD